MQFALLLSLVLAAVAAALSVSETSTQILLKNARLEATFLKSLGSVVELTLDGQDLLGPRSGSTGIGPYLDCYCIPSGFYTVGSTNPVWRVVQGTDPAGTAYAGVILSDTYTPTNQTFQQYWFLRDGETGLHMFTRVAYYNTATPFLRNLQELRTLFRPNAAAALWTHLSTNEEQTAPLPSVEAVKNQVVVQDATWSLKNTPDDPFVKEFSEYFTKYSFSSDWRDTVAHGLYADGSTSNGTAFGAWMVMNTKDTYFGGPLHSDLTVDGIVYNYIVSNHHGEGTPNITHGFDRTFGPQYYHFNSGKGATLQDLRADAESLASPSWNAAFYDSIAPHVANFVPTRGRGKWQGRIQLPAGATRPIAVLSANNHSFQDNVNDRGAFQYWAEVDRASGAVAIDRVVAGTYRLTIYADGIFGDYIQNGIVIRPATSTVTTHTWTAESAGVEIWRLGTPDKSSGEFKRGAARDLTRTRRPRQYWNYWGAYDFPTDFPRGVNYTIGVSTPANDFNTVHWSVFGGTPSRPALATDVNAWTINFALTRRQLSAATRKRATLTLQLAAVKGAAGNTDVKNPQERYADVPLKVAANGVSEDTMTVVVPWDRSSSCVVRSAVACYQVGAKVVFGTRLLREGANRLVLELPFNATDTETAILPGAIYVQYDALRFELA